MNPHRRQSIQRTNELQRPRRATIVSPTGYIHDYRWDAFLALVIVGCLLAFVAGYVNTICIAGAFRLPLTALTGTTSKMGIVLAQGRLDIALHLFLLIFSFTLGNSISAALVGGSSFRIQRHYGLVLFLESIVLALGKLFEDVHVNFHEDWESLSPGAYLICLGCGLQNGMCTTFSGAVIRTTHITGILTDIGLIIGQAIFHKRTRKHLWKLKILVPLYISFCCGAVFGWFANEFMHSKSIIIPCVIVGCLGFGHIYYCKIFLNLNLRKIKNKNQQIYSSTKLSTIAVETIRETNISPDKQSTDTDQIDSDDDDQHILKDSLETQNSFSPLVISIDNTKTKQKEIN